MHLRSLVICVGLPLAFAVLAHTHPGLVHQAASVARASLPFVM